jgi:hypothetical protein
MEIFAAVFANADDDIIFVTALEDIPAIRYAIRINESATGAILNTRKYNAMAVGAWDTTMNIMDISYCTEIRILFLSFKSAVAQFGNTSWVSLTVTVGALATDVYGRDLCLSQRVQYVLSFLLSKIKHKTEFFPFTTEYARQIVTAITWCDF